jgi:hypothetical protein
MRGQSADRRRTSINTPVPFFTADMPLSIIIGPFISNIDNLRNTVDTPLRRGYITSCPEKSDAARLRKTVYQ